MLGLPAISEWQAFLFKVSDSFKVPGPWNGNAAHRVVALDRRSFDQGHTVELRARDGSRSREQILYIGHLTGKASWIGVMVNESAIVKPDTEVWSCD